LSFQARDYSFQAAEEPLPAIGRTLIVGTAYRDFLALWKDADPEIPVLKQAKAEYAKLK
jgi:hypothetical protein